MTTSERMKGLTMKTKIDRVPMNPFASTYTALISNYTAREYYLNPQIALECHMNSMMLHKYDASPTYGVPNWQTWDFGGELEFSLTNRAALPKVNRYPVEGVTDTLKIDLPDIETAPMGSRMIEFSRLSLEKGFGYGVPAGSALTGVESLIGVQQLLKLMIKDPNHIHYLMRISTDYILSIAKYMIDKFGAEKSSALMSYPLEAHELISPKYFEEFSLPYTKEIVETLSKWGVKKMIVHLCGNHTNNLDYWINDIDVPKRTVFTLGTEMDMVRTAERLGDDYIIGGNVKNTTLTNKGPKDVYEESKGIIERLKTFPGGFILMPDCGLSPLTPACNIDAMLRAVKDFGRYE